MAKPYIWSQIETALAILCACLMTFRPLFVNLNLKISQHLSRFSRSKSLASSEAKNSTPDLEIRDQRQWDALN